MSPEGGRAPSLLCLIVIAAALNIYSISSTNTSTTSNILKTLIPTHNSNLSGNISKTVASPVTLSFITTPTPIEKDTDSLSTPNDTSSTSAMTVSTTNLLSKPSTELKSTEQVPSSVMPVHSSATTNISPAGTVATTSGIMSVSPISTSSFAPEDYTSSWVTQLSSTEVSTVPVTSKKHPVEGITSGVTTKPLISSSSVGKSTYSQGTSASKATVETTPIGSATLSSEVTIQEVQRALSSGSIAGITIAVIAVVLLVFGIAAIIKIRHTSYGRLFDDHDYGSWGNYNNPLYDDS